MIVNEKIIDQYIELQVQLDKFLSVSGRITYGYICCKMNMTRPTLRAKLKKRQFNGHELKRLAKVLNDIQV